jgi:hypothetical protein
MIGHVLQPKQPGRLDSTIVACECGWKVTLPDHCDPARRHRIHVAEVRAKQLTLDTVPPPRGVLDVQSAVVTEMFGGET